MVGGVPPPAPLCVLVHEDGTRECVRWHHRDVRGHLCARAGDHAAALGGTFVGVLADADAAIFALRDAHTAPGARRHRWNDLPRVLQAVHEDGAPPVHGPVALVALGENEGDVDVIRVDAALAALVGGDATCG